MTASATLQRSTDALGKNYRQRIRCQRQPDCRYGIATATTRYAYDAEKPFDRMEDAEGSTTSYTYDANGQMTKTTSAMGAETSSTYDALGRQISRRMHWAM